MIHLAWTVWPSFRAHLLPSGPSFRHETSPTSVTAFAAAGSCAGKGARHTMRVAAKSSLRTNRIVFTDFTDCVSVKRGSIITFSRLGRLGPLPMLEQTQFSTKLAKQTGGRD